MKINAPPAPLNYIPRPISCFCFLNSALFHFTFASTDLSWVYICAMSDVIRKKHRIIFLWTNRNWANTSHETFKNSGNHSARKMSLALFFYEISYRETQLSSFHALFLHSDAFTVQYRRLILFYRVFVSFTTQTIKPLLWYHLTKCLILKELQICFLQKGVSSWLNMINN